MTYTIAQANDYHATATVELVERDQQARWDRIAAAMLAEGWRLMGWRCYAIGDDASDPRYRVTADLFRTYADVQSGSLQLTIGG